MATLTPLKIFRSTRQRDGGREEGAREEIQGGRRGLRGPLGQEKANQVGHVTYDSHL